MGAAVTAAALSARPGVSASPTMTELKSFATLVIANAGIPLGANAINRIVVRFSRRMPNATGWTFFLYLANEIKMSAAQKRAAIEDPEVARVISYSDPTGEAAVANVMRKRHRVHHSHIPPLTAEGVHA